jgi:hypothetical protein
VATSIARMRIRVVVLAVTLAAGTGVALAAATTPILAGPWTLHQKGYGHARPQTIDNGGDPTGLVSAIAWHSWGGARATGSGTAEYVGRNQSVAQGKEESARIVAFHLGTCHGKRAYNAVEWYFPNHGGHFSAGNYVNPCTGRFFVDGHGEP